MAVAVTAERQRMAALAEANRVRCAAATLKRDIAAGDVALPDVLRDPPEEIGGAMVWGLLTAVPIVGELKATGLLRLVGVRSPRKKLRDLTVRQREALAVAVERKAWRGL